MKNNILISIIVPTYNEERHVNKCIESLLRQSYSNNEIIIVDDGSNDLTSTIIHRYKRYHAKIITLSHGGPGRAKNIASKVAKGKILVFADADMIYDKNYINNLIQPIIKNQCIGTYTTSEYVANMNNIWSKCWHINSNSKSDNRIINNNFHNIFRAILKKVFISSKGFNPSLGYEDDILLFDNNIHAQPVKNAICYHYNPESLFDVFLSSKWIGQSSSFSLSFHKLMSYSIINSIRN
ncbi:MAG: glycosyltransferase, partial [Nitrososphaeraceae archaeon]|nr:glycosyltransferase [Nitrososphaeraceae archaeon]